MCGIAGYFKKNDSSPLNRDLLERMGEEIAHRGPDGSGIYVNNKVGLVHRRLSVIDLYSGSQPMTDEDTGRVIIFNGEVYNYKGIRSNLLNNGKKFITNSDTEVLLKLGTTDGYDWINQVNGMFAFALFDPHTCSLLIARDRIGIKPIYYLDTDSDFVFSSEIKPLLLYPGLSPDLDVELIPEYLAYRSMSDNRTMFKRINLIGPGQVVLLNPGKKPKFRKYWREECTPSDIKAKEMQDHLESLLIDSVRIRLISDVPLGTFNSGGVDSSLISSIATSLKNDRLHTFSVGFEDDDYDESTYANIVSNKLKTNHHKVVVSEHDYVDEFINTAVTMEEPINHQHTIPLKILCKHAKEFVTVVLTGEGSDELFAGYPRYQIPLISRRLKYLPGVFLDGLLKLSDAFDGRRLIKILESTGDNKKAIIDNSRFVPVRDLDLLGINNYYGNRKNIVESISHHSFSILEQLLLFDRKTYLSSLLTRLDKTSMKSALEARVPFLDYRIIEYSRCIPGWMKITPGFDNKIIVKSISKKWLPKEIIQRRKVGFGVPIRKWLRNKRGFGQYLDLITDQTFKNRGFFNQKNINVLINDHLVNKKDHSEILWGLINLELWTRLFIDNRPFRENKREKQIHVRYQAAIN